MARGNGPAVVEATQPLAFFSARHPNTADIAGPYVLTLRQISGELQRSIFLEYALFNANGERTGGGRQSLQASSPSTWRGAVPGQPPGTNIAYDFMTVTPSGVRVRYPGDLRVSFRFRVVEFESHGVTLADAPPQGSGRKRVTITVGSSSTPVGDLIVRVLSISSEGYRESRVPLRENSVAEPSVPRGLFRLTAELPLVGAGEVADYYFRLRTSTGVNANVPEDAPRAVFSYKNSIERAAQIPGTAAYVLTAVGVDDVRLIGTRGSGLWVCQSRECTRLGIPAGIPSNVVRFVAPDASNGSVYSGTDSGVVESSMQGGEHINLTPAYPGTWTNTGDLFEGLARSRRAGPGSISPFDGSLFFQLQGESALERLPATVYYELRGGFLRRWEPREVKFALIALTSSAYDSQSGCLLLGGLTTDRTFLRPVITQKCGDSLEQRLITDFAVDGNAARPARIIALARDPSTQDILTALEFGTRINGQAQLRYGIYRSAPSGALAPVAPSLAALDTEITSLNVDLVHDRLLAGTFGRGLLEIRNGAVQRVPLPNNAMNITAMSIGDRGTLLVGTSRGAYELGPSGDALHAWGNEGLWLTEALPTDTAAASVLFSSYGEGVVRLDWVAGGWRVARAWSPGLDFPSGNVGEAQFSDPGTILCVLYSRGVLVLRNPKATLYTQRDGLKSNDALRVLSRRRGEIWVLSAPTPFSETSALQILHADGLPRSVKVVNADVPTVVRWLKAPDGMSVLAASRSGLLAMQDDGSVTRLSGDPLSSIAASPDGKTVAVVGSVIGRLENGRLVPVLFRVQHPRWPRGTLPLDNPIDIAIAKDGTWYVLYSGGRIALLAPNGVFKGLLDAEDGIPPSARQIVTNRDTGDILVGSGGEGISVISPR